MSDGLTEESCPKCDEYLYEEECFTQLYNEELHGVLLVCRRCGYEIDKAELEDLCGDIYE